MRTTRNIQTVRMAAILDIVTKLFECFLKKLPLGAISDWGIIGKFEHTRT